MPRPCKRRLVAGLPEVRYFKPQGVPLRDLAEVTLSVEGLEAIRLTDHEGLQMEGAAERMGVSRHTFGRILRQARKNVARALLEGLALRVEGGHYSVENRDETFCRA